MKKRFKLEEWLMDRTKTVCQKDGSHVEILKHNLDHEFCIVGAVRTKTKGETIRQWNHDGRYSSACPTEYDLVFDCEDESEILTDFEKMIGEYLFLNFDPDALSDDKKMWLKDKSKKILENAAKELSIDVNDKIKFKYNGYIAKDQCGTVGLYLHDKPYKLKSEVAQGEWVNDDWDGPAISGEFPMLSWEDEEPTKVKITIEI